jgi:murein tripeptide amidase MpaA
MPPTGYLTANGIQVGVFYLALTYQPLAKLVGFPEQTAGGTSLLGLRIGGATGTARHGVLLIAGQHAREIVNPDLLLSLSTKLLQAYTGGTGLSFGPKSYSAADIKKIVDGLDLFVLPLVNPDGRAFVQSATGDPMWRKNRNPAPTGTQPCSGADLNRNYDLLWSSGIGTSPSLCHYELYKGSSAFSEAETRNVRHLLDTQTNIGCMMDVHSYTQLVLYPWGDAVNQSTDTTMNFANPAWDGLRNASGSGYAEYIDQADHNRFIATATAIKGAIAAVRGRQYTVKQSRNLYPTSGTSLDYAYSRHLVDPAKRKVYAYLIETATEFQPVYTEALSVIEEVSAGLMQFLLECVPPPITCPLPAMVQATELAADLDEMRVFRDEMTRTAAGRRYAELLEKHAEEILSLIAHDDRLLRSGLRILARVNAIVRSRTAKRPSTFPVALVAAADKVLDGFAERASPSLRAAIKEVRGDMKHFRGRSVIEGLTAASRARKN